MSLRDLSLDVGGGSLGIILLPLADLLLMPPHHRYSLNRTGSRYAREGIEAVYTAQPLGNSRMKVSGERMRKGKGKVFHILAQVLWLARTSFPLSPFLLLGKKPTGMSRKTCPGNYFHNRKANRMKSARLFMNLWIMYASLGKSFGFLYHPHREGCSLL